MANSQKLKIGIIGAAGRMGLALVRAISQADDMTLVMAIGNQSGVGQDIGKLAGLEFMNLPLSTNLKEGIAESKPDVIVELSHVASVFDNTKLSLEAGIHTVIGATGISPEQQDELDKLAKANNTGALIVPNFSIGAVLMMKYAQDAAQYYQHAEIIERHHEKKLDSPSGTAIRTAKMMAQKNQNFGKDLPQNQKQLLPGARGANGAGNIPIHSMRLPGSLAHQQVIFGALGETLTIQHDTIDRQAFMGGILLCIRKIKTISGITVGLETLL